MTRLCVIHKLKGNRVIYKIQKFGVTHRLIKSKDLNKYNPYYRVVME